MLSTLMMLVGCGATELEAAKLLKDNPQDASGPTAKAPSGYRILAAASDLTHITQLYVNAQFVYGGGVTEQPTTPGQATEIGTIRQISKRDGSVSLLWSGDGAVVALGEIPRGLVFATFHGRQGQIMLLPPGAQTSVLYSWFSQGSCVSAASDGTESIVSLTAGSQGPILEIDSSGNLVPLATDDCVTATSLLWPDVFWITGQHLKHRDASGNVTTLFTGSKTFAALAVSPTAAAYVEDADGVHVVSGDGSPVRDLPSGSADTLSLVTVQERVFASKAQTGQIVELFPNGAAEQTLITGQSQPVSLTSDGASLYWVNAGDMTVRELPIP